LVVGDATGHGIRSAAIMGQFLTAVRTLAALDLPPEQVLTHLDNLAQSFGDSYLATCIYAVYDPVARCITVANAGSLPPVLLRASGRADPLEIPVGAPIGVGGIAFETVEITVADDDILVLFTDGLVETRGQDIEAGLATLCGNLVNAGLSLNARCDHLLKAL